MEIYHVLNRGVDKRQIFLEEKDYLRFIHNLFEFNDKFNTYNTNYSINKHGYIDIGCRYIEKEKKPRHILVKILAFTLMPNHYHLLLSPVVESGVSKFMQKLNMGYSKYFNQKYKREGALFQSKYKKILVNEDKHLIHLPYYIHLNPLDLSFPEWRTGEIQNFESAIKFLENYKWSSFLDYIGIKNFPSVTHREFLLNFLGEEKNYKEDIIKWLKERDINEIKEFALE